MKEGPYRKLVSVIAAPGCPRNWNKCMNMIPSMTLENRKSLAHLSRAQHIPKKDPFSAGLLMTLIRIAPLPQVEIDKAFESSILKERKVLDEDGLPSQLNYNVFFGSPDECIADGIDPNHSMAIYVQSAIDSWIEETCRKIHYPSISHKTVEKTTSDQAKSIIQKDEIEVHDTSVITQVELERIYHKTGLKVDGPVEMRQIWYPSQLAPRTYFASGGSAYHGSKHVGKMMVDLCETLPPTKKRYRVNPTRLEISDMNHAFIYDLTSFTSNLHEHVHFIRRLAEYCRGNKVQIVDGWRGIVEVDLADLILEYNALNRQGRYSMGRIYGEDTPLGSHCTAGFLGVYGNISNATFLHGAVMLQLCNNTDQLNVAGDDGIIDSSDDNDAFALIRYLGLMEYSKIFTTIEEGCIHLKRPLYQHDKQLVQGSLVLWPSFEYILHNKSEVDPRYPAISRMTKKEWRDALSSSIVTFLTSLSITPLENWMVDVSDAVLSYLYTEMSLPVSGNVPQVHGSTYGFVAQYDRRFIGDEPKANTIRRSYQGVAKIPYRQIVMGVEDDLALDDIVLANSSKALMYLEDLGYLEKKPIHVYVWGEMGLDLLLKEYFEPDPAVYEYTVIRDIPNWLQSLFRN